MIVPSIDTRPCPVCDSYGARQVIYRQKFQEGVLGEGYDIVVCGECGAGFADGIPQQSEFDRYYLEESKYAYEGSDGAESSYDMKRFGAIVDHLAPYFPTRSCRILDVGCATGGLLSVFKRRGYTEIVGADPSPACANAAFRLYGIEVRNATLSQISVWHDKFDLILAVGVLEHVREARNAMQTLVSCLNPGGHIFAAVPDVSGLTSCSNAPFQQFSMEHVNFFSSTSLGRLMANSGLREVKTWNYMVQWREGITEPILSCLFASCSPGRRESFFTFDHKTKAALQDYLDQSSRNDRSISESIAKLVNSRIPVLIWGAGTLTRRLLANSALRQANIAGFIDSNTQLHGRQLAGKNIYSPEQVIGRSECILICSLTFEREIVEKIREQLKLPNKLIMLH